MKKADAFRVITVRNLHTWIEEGKEPVVIDTLPEDHYRKRHLPGAQNACVYQVVFPTQVQSIVPDRDRLIVVYGSSQRSQDAATAAEKLTRHGYQNVFALQGGLDAWREAGYRLDGEEPGGTDEPERIRLEDRTYSVDTERSVVEWSGRNANTKHFGTLRLSKGEITVRDGALTGSFEIDFESIKNLSLEGDPLQSVLIAHLKSDDFFFVERFPRATFTIDSATWVSEPTLSAPNLDVKGTLELHGERNPISFSATLNQLADGAIAAEAHFDIDRTHWGVIYGSSRYFEHLGMHLVFDPISIQLRIVAG